MLLNLFFHDISEHTISTTLVLLRYLSILDVSLTIVEMIHSPLYFYDLGRLRSPT